MDEIHKEQEALRREFEETLSKVTEDSEYFHKLVGDTGNGFGGNAPTQQAATRDIYGDGRLMKRIVKSSSSPAKLPKFGDEVRCRCEAKDKSEILFESESCIFCVGSLRLPQMFSGCAVVTALGETAEFDVDATLVFEDDRFRDSAWSDRRPTSISFVVELKEIRRSHHQSLVQDLSGELGPGNILTRTKQDSRPPLQPWNNCDVEYEAEYYYPTVSKNFGWPDEDLEDELFLADLGHCALLETKKRVVSKCKHASLFCAEDDDEARDSNYVERAMVEAMMSSPNTEYIFFLSKKAASLHLRRDHSVLVKAKAVEWTPYADCFQNRPGAVVKRTTRFGERGTKHPRNTDIVQVRGLVKIASAAEEGSKIACAYGSDVLGASTSPPTRARSDDNVGATWSLDEDDSVRLFGNEALKGPLCAGVEVAVRSMVVGEVADFVVSAKDLGFVRPPPSAEAPKHARATDIDAYHYASDAYKSLGEEAFSAPLRIRLELVDRRPTYASLGERRYIGMASIIRDLDSPATALADAQDLKARGAKHFKERNFDRASRRYGDALVCVGVGLEAIKVFRATARREASTKTASEIIAEETYPKPSPRKPEPNAEKQGEETAKSEDEKLEMALTDIETTLRLNRAACDLKRCRYERCIEDCQSVLSVKPDDIKARYRSGLAYMSLRDFDNARSCFEACLHIDQRCVDARKGLSTLVELRKQRPPFSAAPRATTGKGGFGQSNKRRPRDPKKGGPDDPPEKVLSKEEKLERDFLGDLERDVPPWIRKKREEEEGHQADHNDRPSKRTLGSASI